MRLLAIPSIVAVGVAAAVPVDARAQSSATESARAALSQAQAASAAARDALRRADEALAKAEIALALAEGRGAPTVNAGTFVDAPVAMLTPATGSPVANSGACDSTTRITDVVAGSSTDPERKKVYPINVYARECLGLSDAKQFKAADISLLAGVQENDGAIEIAPSYTIRYAGEHAGYFKLLGSLFAAPDDDDSNRTAFHDFTDTLSGDGFGLGIEIGSFAGRTQEAREKLLREGLAKARRACVSEKTISGDFDTGPTTTPRFEPSESLAQCTGSRFDAWLKENGKDHWSATLGKLYEAENANPQFVGGLSMRKSWKTVQYLTPAAIAGFGSTSTLADLKAARFKADVEPLLIKGYVGASIATLNTKLDGLDDYWGKVGIGGIVSLSYRREWEVTGEDEDQTLCGVEGAISRCGKFNLSAPQKVAGWIPAASFNFALPRAWYLPALGFSTIFSFDTAGDRFGAEVPLYFGFESDKLTAGVKYFYREAGILDNGFKLDKSEGVALFIGSSFSLLNGR